MYIVEADTVNELYLKLMIHFKNKQAQLYSGTNHGTYIEERNAILYMDNPYSQLVTLRGRNLSLRYLAGEFACYLNETTTEAFAHYSKLWKRIDVDGIAQSNYGRIIFTSQDSLPSWYDYAKQNLLKSRDTKNAIIMIQSAASKRPGYNKDRPCAMSIQFFIRNDKLEMDVCLRSSDVWLGLPYDFHWFSFVQQRMYNDILDHHHPLLLGPITYHIASLHCYERHFDKLFTSNECSGDLLPLWEGSAEEALSRFLEWEQTYRTQGLDNSVQLPLYLKQMQEFILYNRKVNDYE